MALVLEQPASELSCPMESRDAVVAVGAAGAAEETREIAEGGHHRGDHLGTDPGRRLCYYFAFNRLR